MKHQGRVKVRKDNWITLIRVEEENSESKKYWLATYSSLTADTMDHDFQTNCQLSHLWAKNRSWIDELLWSVFDNSGKKQIPGL